MTGARSPARSGAPPPGCGGGGGGGGCRRRAARRAPGLAVAVLLAAAALLLRGPGLHGLGFCGPLLATAAGLLTGPGRCPGGAAGRRPSESGSRRGPSVAAAAAASAELRDPDLRRFEVGTRVRCRMSETDWVAGVVMKSNYGPPQEVAAYQVKLDGGFLIWVPVDDDQIIQGTDFWDSPLGALRKRYERAHAVQWQRGQRELPATAGAVPVVPHQLKRDIEQFEHLLSRDVLDSDIRGYVADAVLPDYRCALEAASSALAGSQDDAFTLDHRPEFEAVFSLHQKALHLDPGDPVPGEAIRARDFDAVERDFAEKEHKVVVMDDFFSPEALTRIREFLLDSTFWSDAKSGYVGAYAETGFASPLVAQIDQELRSKFPNVIGGLELQNCWAFMFDGSMGGVQTHADNAQVQINFFLTPTEANEWSEDRSLPGGGLVIYGIGPPEGQSLFDINVEDDSAKEHILASIGHWNLTAPYVENRALLFDSTYFHRTDDMRFKKGYKNRRINMTFLYGRRANLKPAAVVGAV